MHRIEYDFSLHVKWSIKRILKNAWYIYGLEDNSYPVCKIGLMTGLLSVKGFTQKIEPVLWLLFGITTSLVLTKNIEQKTFLHGLLIGIAWGICYGVIQTEFFETYLANNPSLLHNFQKKLFTQPGYLVLVTAPIFGLITGLILAGCRCCSKNFGSTPPELNDVIGNNTNLFMSSKTTRWGVIQTF